MIAVAKRDSLSVATSLLISCGITGDDDAESRETVFKMLLYDALGFICHYYRIAVLLYAGVTETKLDDIKTDLDDRSPDDRRLVPWLL